MSYKTLDIGEVSRQSGVNASALRYYETLGLIQSQGRRGLRRIFSDQVLDHLALITLGQKAGFTLNEIKQLLLSENTAIDKEQLRQKADTIAIEIKQLKAIHHLIQHVACCPEKNQRECAKFQQLLRLAQKHNKRK